MSTEDNTPKNNDNNNKSNNSNPNGFEKSQVNENFERKYSNIGDLNIKNEGHYAKPFINEIQKPSENNGSSSDNKSSE